MWQLWTLGALIVALFCISVLPVALLLGAAWDLIRLILEGTCRGDGHDIMLVVCMIPGMIVLLIAILALKSMNKSWHVRHRTEAGTM